MMEVLQLFSANMAAYVSSALVLGLLLGSFLNVVIYRFPIILNRSWRMQCAELTGEPMQATEVFNLVVPRSRCPTCGHAIHGWENIPLLSYFVQKGRCNHCGQPIGVRYPLVEAITAAMTAMVAWHFGFGWQALAAMALTWGLIALTVIDFDHQLLPDDITLPFLWLGLALNVNGLFTDLASAVIGTMAGYLSLWLVFQAFRLLTGKEGMGYGDFKLLAMLGAWLGWQALPLVILLSSVVGAVAGISMIVIRRHDKNIPIPFGPYLAAAGWITLLWGDQLTRAYLGG